MFAQENRPLLRWWLSTLAGIGLVVAILSAVKFGGKMPGAQAQQPPRPLSTPNPRPSTNNRPAATAARPAGVQTQAPAPVVNAPAGEIKPPKIAAVRELKVVATVNNEQITRQQLGAECSARYGKEVIEGMINRQLIAQACDEHRIVVTDAAIDEEISKMATRFKLSVDRWLDLLREERGFSAEEYRREVVWPMLAMRQLTAAKVTVSPQELQDAFEAEYGPRVRVRIIDFSQMEKAQAVRAQAAAAPDKFPELAKLNCEDPNVGSASGVVPPIRRHMGDRPFEEAVFKLKKGEISQVLTVGNKHFVVKCEDHLPATPVPSQHQDEVDKQLTERIKENKLRSAAGDLFKEMQTKAQLTNVMRDPKLQQQYPGVAAIVNGKAITMLQLADECVVRHGREVLDGEINRKLLAQELAKKQLAISEQDIDLEVARAAETYGFLTKDDKPDVERWMKEITTKEGATAELYRRDAVWPSVALKKLVGQATVTEEDMQKGFESNYGEKVEVLAIVCGDQRQAQKVWEMARNLPTEASFAELAKQYSVEPVSRSNGGKVPPIRKFSGQGKVEEAAFALKPGELSAIIATSNQFVIMRCLGRTKPLNVKYADVKKEIYKDLEEQKLRLMMTKRFDELKDAAYIDNHLTGEGRTPRRTKTADTLPARNGEAPRTSAAPATGTRAQPVSAPRK